MNNDNYVIDKKRNMAWGNQSDALAWYRSELDRVEGLLAVPPATITKGCGKKLAGCQYWTFCGETDMGQTDPALCVECGGIFRLP